jgi:ribonuclease HI
MKTLRDRKTQEIFEVDEYKVDDFFENYEAPNDLMIVNCWYCDGSGFNGKTSSVAYGTSKEDMKIQIFEKENTNNQMEYAAVILAATHAERFDVLRTDSQLVVNQVSGKWRNNFVHLREACKILAMLMKEKDLMIQWIPREENIAGQFIEVKNG